MQDQTGKTKMVASQDGKTKMVLPVKDTAEKVGEGLVRIKTIRAINVGEQTYAEDAVLDVSPEIATEFCDKKFTGSLAHWGETLDSNAKHHEIVRAVRV